MFKSAHIGINTAPLDVGALVDVAHPGPPYHESIPRRVYMPDVGKPVLWQASNTYSGHIYTAEQFCNVLDQPHFNNWWILANEEDLGWSTEVPAQTPSEFVAGVVANMRVLVAVIPKTIPASKFGGKLQPRRLILSGGSHHGVNSGWTRQMLETFQQDAPDILVEFDCLAVNYYASPAPLDALTYLQWLRGIKKMLNELGLAHWTVFGKEIGAPIRQPLGHAQRSAAQGNAVNFIEEFFPIARLLQERGKLEWLEGIGWFAATAMIGFQGEDLGMPYAPLWANGQYTRAGRKWLVAGEQESG